MKRILCVVTAVFALATFDDVVLATESGTMRCSGGLVSLGNTAAEVVGKCGSPAFTTQRREKRGAPGGKTSERTELVTLDDWTFNFGPNEFQYAVLLEYGRVVRIESLDRGY
ncbi:DUF2845 domain-containing protein [Geomesophilobacter sediminis]|uniref:DUF2845 domain-containing protein n=1 Tax=Geomesophilobacter sediminis TaxID=2798584 RepID=A0A8J7M0V1_9BACT|nr:DUF2845 domain-containing protein [Geomesophilobacter sediminis]MBJ6726555.1 DUF2845 domain-containing protein [Geomesophilobacter sediminis]